MKAIIFLIGLIVLSGCTAYNELQDKCLEDTPAGYINTSRDGLNLICFYETLPELEYDICSIYYSDTKYHGIVKSFDTCQWQEKTP